MRSLIKTSVLALAALAVSAQSTSTTPVTVALDANLTLSYQSVYTNGSPALKVDLTLANQKSTVATPVTGYWVGIGFLGDASARANNTDFVNCTIAVTGWNKTVDAWACSDNYLDTVWNQQRDVNQSLYNVTTKNTFGGNATVNNATYSVSFIRNYTTNDVRDFNITDGTNINVYWGYG